METHINWDDSAKVYEVWGRVGNGPWEWLGCADDIGTAKSIAAKDEDRYRRSA